MSNTQVAHELHVTNATVGRWRSRFIARGPAGLLDEPKCGAPRRVSDEQVEAVVVKTLESTPRNATHWSTRSMAEASGLSDTTVLRIWRAFGLQPHRSDTFKLSTDPQLIEKVRDIVGLYLNRPEGALVLCTDEKSQIQALDRTQPIFRMRPGSPELRSHDYRRHGTTSLLPPSMSRRAKSSAKPIVAFEPSSFAVSSIASQARFPPTWTSIWCLTTTARTRPP